MREKWNKRYREKGPESFGNEPSEWLNMHRSYLGSHLKGKALDLACGNGRNARFLAQMGFEVDALDIADVAIEWLEDQAKKESLPIYTQAVDLINYQLPKAKYQVIINFNFLERSLFESIQQALLPGGLLFFETFIQDHIHVLGKSMSGDFVLAPNELLKAFPGLHIIHYWEGIWGDKKPRAIASFLGKKI